MSGIFNAAIFNNTIFNTGAAGAVVADVVKTGTGGIDPGGGLKRRTIVKPTGLWEKKKLTQPQVQVEQRIDSFKEIQTEISERLAREFTEDYQDLLEAEREAELEKAGKKRLAEMTSREIDREIGVLMRERLRLEKEEEELLMMLMIAANE